LMVGSILFGLLVKVRAELKAGKPLAVFKVSLIVSAIMYNFSEAAFHGANNIWLLLLLAILNVSTREPDGASSIETGHISMSTAAGRRS